MVRHILDAVLAGSLAGLIAPNPAAAQEQDHPYEPPPPPRLKWSFAGLVYFTKKKVWSAVKGHA